MDRNKIAREILRSICAKDPQEQVEATANYRISKLDVLSFDGVAEKLLEKIHLYYRKFSGPPTFASLKEEALVDQDTVLSIYTDEVETERALWGASYAKRLEDYVQTTNDEAVSDTLAELSQIQKEGRNVDGETLKGSLSAIDHAIHRFSVIKRNSDPLRKIVTTQESIEELRTQFAERAANPVMSYGLTTDLSPIDSATKGAQNKELWMVAGFTCDPESEIFDFNAGDFRRLGDLKEATFEAATWNGDQVTTTTQAYVFDSTVKNRVSFYVDGQEQRVSKDHPFYTPTGWVKTEFLKTGDWVARPSKIDWESLEEHVEEAYIIGLLLGDGSLTETVIFESSGKELIDRYCEKCSSLGWNPGEVKPVKSKDNYYRARMLKSEVPETLQPYLGKNALTKEIHPTHMKWGNDSISKLLAGIWDIDGWVSNGKGGWEIGITLNSERLIKQIQILLLRLGIPSQRLQPTKKTYTRNGERISSKNYSYRLKVKTAYLRRFMEKVPTLKNQPLDYEETKGRLPSSLITDEWFALCQEKHQLEVGSQKRSREEWAKRENHWFYHLKRARKSDSVETWVLEKALSKVPNDGIFRNLKLDWAKIRNYRIGDPIPMVDYTVPETHNLVVDGCLQHNTSHGKSTFLLNWSRFLAYEGGFHVAYFSLEMARDVVWRVIAAGHSMNPKFPNPLEYSKIKDGSLEPEDADLYSNVILPDLANMPGEINVVNPSGAMTMEDIQAIAESLNRERPLDLIVIDYIGILSPSKEQRRMGKSERINENIIKAKRLATDFDNGVGCVVASAHQINRQGFQRAQENGGVYDMSAIADANEAERTSDVLLALYQDKPMRSKREAVITNLKTRDGALSDPFHVYMPQEHRFIGELENMEEEQLSSILEA